MCPAFSFKNRRHTEQAKQRIRDSVLRHCGRGQTYEQRYGALTASYLKELRKQQWKNQTNKPSFAGRKHSDEAKQKISVAAQRPRRRKTKKDSSVNKDMRKQLHELNPAGSFGFMQNTTDNPKSPPPARANKQSNTVEVGSKLARSGKATSNRIKLGGVTQVIINPTMQQTQANTGNNSDGLVRQGKARKGSTVFESVESVLAAARRKVFHTRIAATVINKMTQMLPSTMYESSSKKRHKRIAATVINRLRSDDYVNSGSDVSFRNTSNESADNKTCSFPGCHRFVTRGSDRCSLHARRTTNEAHDPFGALVGGVIGYSLGKYFANKRRQRSSRVQSRSRASSLRPSMSSRMWNSVKAKPRVIDHTMGPWGPRSPNTANITGPRIKKPEGFPKPIHGITPLTPRDRNAVRATYKKMKYARPFDDPLDDLFNANDNHRRW